MSAPPESLGESTVFSERTRRVVIAVAVLSLVATVGALVFGRRLSTPPAQPRDSYGAGPLGHRAFLETLRELGVHAERWAQPTYEPVSAPLFIIEPNQPWITQGGLEVSLGRVVRERATANRVTVVVLPKWAPGLLGSVGPEDGAAIDALLAEMPFDVALVRGPIETNWQTLTARQEGGVTRQLALRWPQRVEGGVAVMVDDGGGLVVSDPKGLVYVVSDPDLLHSFNLQRGDHAAFWRDFVRDTLRAEDVVIDELFHGAVQTRSLPELFGTWPGVLVLVHGALIALVVLLMGRRREGPPAPAPVALGRGPREVIDVAASVLANGTRPTVLALRYVEDVIADLHRRLGLTEASTPDARAAQVDQAAQRRMVSGSAVALLGEARALATTRRAREALGVARRAAALRSAVLGTKHLAAPTEPRRG